MMTLPCFGFFHMGVFCNPDIRVTWRTQELGLLDASALSYQDANKVFRDGLELHTDEQIAELVRTGDNVATNAFAKVGLYPFNYQNESWTQAIQSLGKLTTLKREFLPTYSVLY